MQRLRRLVGRRTARQAEGTFIIEGAKVLGEALAAGVPVESIYVDRSLNDPDRGLDPVLDAAFAAGARLFELAPGVLGRVAGTVTPQPVIAICPQMDVPLEDLRPADLLVVCVDLRDPGNAGTVIRSAEAAGAKGIICTNGTVDVFNPKTVRASAGALFRIPVVVGGQPQRVLGALGEWGLARLAATARGGDDYTEVDLTGPVALVIGNEAHGLPPGLDAELDGQVTIPMAGRAESLNAGMAAAVLCFEAARQRRAARRVPATSGPAAAGRAP